jgi:hypothetical protein
LKKGDLGGFANLPSARTFGNHYICIIYYLGGANPSKTIPLPRPGVDIGKDVQ